MCLEDWIKVLQEANRFLLKMKSLPYKILQKCSIENLFDDKKYFLDKKISIQKIVFDAKFLSIKSKFVTQKHISYLW